MIRNFEGGIFIITPDWSFTWRCWPSFRETSSIYSFSWPWSTDAPRLCQNHWIFLAGGRFSIRTCFQPACFQTWPDKRLDHRLQFSGWGKFFVWGQPGKCLMSQSQWGLLSQNQLITRMSDRSHQMLPSCLRRAFLAAAIPIHLKGIAGPGAPHVFKFQRRSDCCYWDCLFVECWCIWFVGLLFYFVLIVALLFYFVTGLLNPQNLSKSKHILAKVWKTEVCRLTGSKTTFSDCHTINMGQMTWFFWC